MMRVHVVRISIQWLVYIPSRAGQVILVLHFEMSQRGVSLSKPVVNFQSIQRCLLRFWEKLPSVANERLRGGRMNQPIQHTPTAYFGSFPIACSKYSMALLQPFGCPPFPVKPSIDVELIGFGVLCGVFRQSSLLFCGQL